METGIKVGDCMEAVLVTIQDSATIVEAAAKMSSAKVSSLMITDARGQVSGIVTETDLVRKALATGNVAQPVGKIASTSLVKIDAGADVAEAAKLMGQRKIKKLLVTEDGKISGIISQSDIIRITPSLYELIASGKSSKGQ